VEGLSPHPSGIKHRKIVLMRDRAALDDIKLSLMGKLTWPFSHALSDGNMITGYGVSISLVCENWNALLEEKVLYKTLKGSISAMYLEPLKGSIHS